MPPERFGRYVLIGRLGQGGMAEASLAVIAGKGGARKLFVIKRPHRHIASDADFVAMFLDEARLAAQLAHPHCVHVVDVGEVEGRPYLAMEYLEGQPLDRLLRSASTAGPIPVPIVVRIIADVLDGLHYAHELTGLDGRPLGVVHRDVSPQNVLVTYDGNTKVLDFGIAKAASNRAETRSGVVKGKYGYMAPEQARRGRVDRSADVWAAGVVLWELLTGHRLFIGLTEIAALEESLHAPIHPPSTRNEGVPPEIDEICMRALERAPERRYPTAAAMRGALLRWLRSQSQPSERDPVAAFMKARFDAPRRADRRQLIACLQAAEQESASMRRLIRHVEGGGDAGESALETGEQDALGAAGAPPTSRRAPSSRPPRASLAPRRLVSPLSLAALAASFLAALWWHQAPSPSASAPAALGSDATGAEPPHALVDTPPPEGLEAPPQAAAPQASVEPATADAPVVAAPMDRERTAREAAPPRPLPGPDTTADPLLPVEVTDTPQPSTGVGHLTLMTAPWTHVYEGDHLLGDTPLIRAPLGAGRHVLRLVNPLAGVSESYAVDIVAGETTTRSLGLSP